jgi:hypothetical protein
MMGLRRVIETRWVGVVLCTLVISLPLALRAGSASENSGGHDPAGKITVPLTAGQINPPPENVLPPAANLKIHLAQVSEVPEVLLDPAADIWQRAEETTVLLSRTPRVYQTEQPAWQRPTPELNARATRSNDQLYVHLSWTDATCNAPQAPPVKAGVEGGDPAVLYKQPTGATGAFSDAVAVMVPDQWNGPTYPSLMMGDEHQPMSIYYWSASRGAALLSASGRTTPQAVPGITVEHRAEFVEGRWSVTMRLPNQPESYPLAFAVWDGEHGDRDGLKYFSVWYVLNQ